jgi:integrase/recombinase XerD
VLAIYKRHAAPCPQKSRQYRRCNCPCWVEGTVEGKYYRKSLKTRNWERATKLAREIEEGKKPRVTITEATDAFVRDAEARGLRPASVYKYRLLFKQLKAFSKKEGLQLLSECDVETLRRFRESWINKNYSARKKLEALRTFFRFAHESSWADSNPALLIKPTKVDDPPTLPYTQAEFRSVVEACGKYPRPDHPNERRGARLKALVLLLRYSGLRITDAVTLSKHQIEDGVLKLRTAKTGTDVRVPLPPRAVAALDALPTTGGYYFWSGHGTKKSCVGDYQRSFKKLYKLAGVQNGHAHRWRDTFAVELLLSGMPIEQVSLLLGHQSIAVTERHYSPFVKARQEQLEASVRKTFETDKMAYR